MLDPHLKLSKLQVSLKSKENISEKLSSKELLTFISLTEKGLCSITLLRALDINGTEMHVFFIVDIKPGSSLIAAF